MTEASSDTVLPDTVTTTHEGFGAVLKREREAQGISLGDMATLSRLSVDQVRALESEDIEKLPLPVYTRAFIRDVAKQLDIDHAPLVADYVARFGEADEGQIPPEDPSAEVVISHRHDNRGIKISGICLIVALVLIGSWGVYTGLLAPEKNDTLTPVAVDASPVVTEEKAVVEALPKAQTPTEKPIQASMEQKTEVQKTVNALPAPDVKPSEKKAAEPVPKTTEEPASLEANQHLIMKVKRNVWIHIRSIRGQNLLANTVKAGTTIDMMIPHGSHFTIGNSAAVEMTVDGDPYSFEDNASRGIAKFILK